MSTILNLNPHLREALEAQIRAHEYEEVLSSIFQTLWDAYWDESFKLRYNHLPELDQLIQWVGREILGELNYNSVRQRGTVNVFIASEVYPFGGHTRVLEDLIRQSDKESIVILTDIFGGYANGNMELGRVANQLNAPICVLPKMPLLEKTRSLLGILNAIDVNTIGIFAHHQDVVAYAACNDNLGFRQVFIHHADHHPTLGATVAHYDHIDLWPGNFKMCEDAGFVTPKYMPPDVVGRFQELPSGGVFNTATSGTFNKFATEGPLNYADVAVAILNSISGNHVHFGDIPQPYLEVIGARLREASIDPSRFVYCGTVPSLQQALIDQNVSVYVTSAPVGGSKAYIEALSLGIGVLLYTRQEQGDLTIVRYHDQLSYAQTHLRWSDVGQLTGHLNNLDLESEFEKSRSFFSGEFKAEEFREIVAEYF